MGGFTVIDPGITTFDELGRAKLSPHAIKLPAQNSGAVIPPSPLPDNTPKIAPTPQSLGQVPESGPILNQRQGSGMLPTTSIPSEIYKIGASEAPNREAMQPTGARSVMNRIAGILGGVGNPGKAPTYSELQNRPYNQAMQDWSTKLAAIKPELEQENIQTREKGENVRAEAIRKDAEARQKSIEDEQKRRDELTERQRVETEKRDADTAKAKEKTNTEQRRRDDLADSFRKEKEKRDEEKDKTRLGIEERRLKLEEEKNKDESKGSWENYVDPKTGAITQQYNAKLGAFRPFQGAAPEVMKPGDYAKKETKLAPVRAANSFADNYLKSGRFDGPHDEALLEKYFELAKPSSGFRMTAPQMDMLIKSRGLLEGMKARGKHLEDGSYFEKTQREQIVKTMKDLAISEDPNSSTSQIQNPNQGKIIRRESN